MRRTVTVVAGVAVAGVLSVSGAAWACTPQARIVAASPAVGPPLSGSSVRGEAVVPDAPVEIRWNAMEGPLVGRAIADSQGRFSAAVAVPDVAPGVYTLVAMSGTAGLTRTAFEVTPGVAAGVAERAPVSPWTPGPGSDDGPAGSGSSQGLAVGAGVLAVGLAGVFGGFAVAGRRRALSGSSSGR